MTSRETAYDRLLDRLRELGKKVKQDRPNHAMASCPGPNHSHGNRRMSLSITGIEGQILMYCHVGCETEDILQAIGWRSADLFDDPKGATYRYDDGREVYRSPSKGFTQGGNKNGQATLYRKAKVQQAVAAGRLIFVVEGEKDVHSIEMLGEVATTAPMGAKNVHKCDLSPLHGARVIAIVDKPKEEGDTSGESWARYLRGALRTKAEIEFRQAAAGKDAADHIAAGLGLDQLEPYAFPRSAQSIKRRTGDWLGQQVIPPLQWVVPNIIPEGYSLLVGAPKIGKSWLSMSIALAVATGGFMFGKIYCGRPRPVLLLALEDSDRRLQSRIRALTPGEAVWPAKLHYDTEIETGWTVNMVIEEWLIEDIQPDDQPVVILDTIGKVLPPAFQGESQYQRDYRFSSSLQGLAKQRPGMALIGLHHDRKASSEDFVESISGTNGIAGAADTLLVINRPRNEPEGLLKITGRDVEENEYGIKLIEGNWSLMGDNLKEAAKSARTVHATVGLGDRSADIVEFVADHPEGVRAQDVADQLDMIPDDAGKYLIRLYKAGRIRRAKRGLYTPVSKVSGVSFLKPPEKDTSPTKDRGYVDARAREVCPLCDKSLADPDDQCPGDHYIDEDQPTCSVCGEYMTITEPGQTTHPLCEDLLTGRADVAVGVSITAVGKLIEQEAP